MSKTTAEVLKKARARLIEKGWTHGGSGQDGEKLCVALSIHNSTKVYKQAMAAVDAMHRTTGSHSLATWNDVPGRTKRQVLGALDKAIRSESRKR